MRERRESTSNPAQGDGKRSFSLSHSRGRRINRVAFVLRSLTPEPICFGMKGWGCGQSEAAEITNTFLEVGGNFIDTADMYSSGISEEMVGHAIAHRTRDDLVLALLHLGDVGSLDHSLTFSVA